MLRASAQWRSLLFFIQPRAARWLRYSLVWLRCILFIIQYTRRESFRVRWRDRFWIFEDFSCSFDDIVFWLLFLNHINLP